MKTKIFDVSYEGAGVGQVDGKIVFVPKTLPGEEVEFSPVKQTNSFAVGKVEKISTISPHRTESVCPYFDECGGCDFLHCDYEYEKELKTKILADELKKVGFHGKIEYQPNDKRLCYRNKIKFEIRENKLGFFKAKSNEFLEIKKCFLASEKIENAANLVREFLQKFGMKHAKSVYIKEFDENVAICFLFDKNIKNWQKNAKNLRFFGNFSVFFAFGKILESDKTQIVCAHNPQNLCKSFMGVKAGSSISAFNQINDFVAEKLYNFVLEKAKGKRVVNAYSGQGLLSYLLSKECKFVYGIEYQKSAHESAENLIDAQNVKNICGKVEEELSQILLADKISLIILDPAREGCDKAVLGSIISGKIPEIFYISCNFSSLTRDIAFLSDFYEIESVKIFDMFPCTANMETACILRRKSKI